MKDTIVLQSVCIQTPIRRNYVRKLQWGKKIPTGKGELEGRSVGKKWQVLSGERDNHTCQACGEEHDKGSLYPVHHLRPERLGGPDEPWNLVTLCSPCHYRAVAQEGDYKIPQTQDGEPIRDLEDLKERWENYQKQEN